MMHGAGEMFEPSKGTRGMMERWKGARLAARENKEKDKAGTAIFMFMFRTIVLCLRVVL